jgi:DNA polymerase elongation subunit (family B)
MYAETTNGLTVVFDFETTPIGYPDPRILTAVFLGLSPAEEAVVFQNTSGVEGEWDDAEVCRNIRDYMVEYGLNIGWNSNDYDLNLLTKRLREHGEEVPIIESFDLKTWVKTHYPYAKDYHLDTWAKAVNTEYQKTPFEKPIWEAALAGDKQAFGYIIDHNVKDVFATRAVYERLFPSAENEQW